MFSRIRNHLYHMDLPKNVAYLESILSLIFIIGWAYPVYKMASSVPYHSSLQGEDNTKLLLTILYCFTCFRQMGILSFVYEERKLKESFQDWRFAPSIIYNHLTLRAYITLQLRLKKSKFILDIVGLHNPTGSTSRLSSERDKIKIFYELKGDITNKTFSYMELGGKGRIMQYKMIANLILKIRAMENPTLLMIEALDQASNE